MRAPDGLFAFRQQKISGNEALNRATGRSWSVAPPTIWSESGYNDALQAWVSSQRVGVPASMSNREFQAARGIARLIRASQPREFSPGTELGGFTLEQAHNMWDTIHSFSLVAALLTAASLTPDSALMSPTRRSLVESLRADTGNDVAAVDAFLDTLTFDPAKHPDPAIAPLIADPVGFLIPPILVSASNFERNLLRLVSIDPSRQGVVGDERGRRGATLVANLMRTHVDVEVREGIEVARGGSVLGDLDVVALDLRRNEGVIIEVKWPAPPDHIIEILRIEDSVTDAQERAAQLRVVVESGDATVRGWPGNWPDYGDVQWTWLVLVKDHLPYSVEARVHPVRPTSWELLWARNQHRLADTVTRLFDSKLLPQPGKDFDRKWYYLGAGPYKVEIEGFTLRSP